MIKANVISKTFGPMTDRFGPITSRGDTSSPLVPASEESKLYLKIKSSFTFSLVLPKKACHQKDLITICGKSNFFFNR